MVTTLKNSRAVKWTWSSARFVRQTPNEKQTESSNRLQSFYRARYYDVTTGEFTSRDPLEYVNGMSLMRGYFLPNRFDPHGLCPDGFVDRSRVIKEFLKRIKRRQYRLDRLVDEFALPRSSSGQGIVTTVNCWQTNVVCVRPNARSRFGNQIDKTNSPWEFVSAIDTTAFSGITVPCWFKRSYEKTFELLEEWDIVHQFSCRSQCRTLERTGWTTWQPNDFLAYSYVATAILETDKETSTTGSEMGRGIGTVDAQTGWVDCKDPSGHWHRNVAYFPITPIK